MQNIATYENGKDTLPMESRMELLPGVYLRAIQTDKFKTGCLSLNFVRPLTASEAPLASLLPSVLLRGTAHYPDIRSISSFLDAHYGASVGALVRKKGEILTTGFFADFLEEALLPAGEQVFSPILDFLGELLFAPRMENGMFLPDAVEGEKRNLLDSIDWRINDKRSYAKSQMIAAMCAGEAFGIPRIGNRAEAEAITHEQLVSYYQRVLTNSRLELFYMGRRDPETVATEMTSLLRPLPRGAVDPVQTVYVGKTGPVRMVEEGLDVTQGKLCMGLRTGTYGSDPLYPALMLLNVIFGAGPTSKLFMNVREKMSLCYYASSSLDRFKGIMVISSGIEFQNFEIAKTEILRQLDACICGDITDEEMENARRALLSALRASLDAPSRMDEYLLGCALSGRDESVEALMEQIRAVTLPQVQEAASRLCLDTVYFLKGVKE